VKPAALMISPEAPYPLDGGGALRTASLLHYLGARYDLDLIVFRHPGQTILEFLPEGLLRNVKTIDLRLHQNDALSRAVRNAGRLLKRRPPLFDRFSGYDAEIREFIGGRSYDVGVLEHFWCASYLPLLRQSCRRAVLDLHNVESAWHAGCAVAAKFPRSLIHRLFEQSALRQEHRWLTSCDLALAASAEDAWRVRTICPGLAVCVYPNAIPSRNVIPGEPDFAIAFSGNMEYEPNRTALAFFLGSIWPLLKKRFPELIFRVIGKNPQAVAAEVHGRDGVECIGPVEDTFPHLSRAMVSVAPLLSGSGTRLKIIEAWAAERPVVSTPIGAEGLGAENGESILLASEPGEFANLVGELLTDTAVRQKIAKSGRAQYERNFTWNAAWEALSGSL
jgi:glycosyltransferase involved in cell wall biosynthesis